MPRPLTGAILFQMLTGNAPNDPAQKIALDVGAEVRVTGWVRVDCERGDEGDSIDRVGCMSHGAGLKGGLTILQTTSLLLDELWDSCAVVSHGVFVGLPEFSTSRMVE